MNLIGASWKLILKKKNQQKEMRWKQQNSNIEQPKYLLHKNLTFSI